MSDARKYRSMLSQIYYTSQSLSRGESERRISYRIQHVSRPRVDSQPEEVVYKTSPRLRLEYEEDFSILPPDVRFQASISYLTSLTRQWEWLTMFRMFQSHTSAPMGTRMSSSPDA